MPASPIRKLMPLADDARRRGLHVYHLNIGQPDLETPAPMRARLAAVRREDLRLHAVRRHAGVPALAAGVLPRLGITLGLNELMATTGGSEAILFALLACANEGRRRAGGRALLHELRRRSRPWPACAWCRSPRAREDGFHLPPRDAWERALTPRTRLVILCNPNNPTGTVYTRGGARGRGLLLPRARGLFLISDEVYREFVYDGRRAICALTLPGCEDLVVVVDSLSKRYSACGIRLGCLATRNREVHQACVRMAQSRLSAPGLAQVVAAAAVELGPEYTQGVVAEYQRRRDVLFEGLTGDPRRLPAQAGGRLLLRRAPPGADAEDFARFLLTDFQKDGATVMVAPAQGFYASPGLGATRSASRTS